MGGGSGGSAAVGGGSSRRIYYWSAVFIFTNLREQIWNQLFALPAERNDQGYIVFDEVFATLIVQNSHC